MYTESNKRPLTKRQASLGWFYKFGVPEAKEDARRQSALPIRLRSDDVVQTFEKPFRVILHFDINVEPNVMVLRLFFFLKKKERISCDHTHVGEKENSLNVPS